MFSNLHHEQMILENAQSASLSRCIESFLIDRQAEGLSQHTIKFYRQNLGPFHLYCDDNGIKLVQDVTPDLLRRYFLSLSETHNAGGVHAHYRTLRAMFRWLAIEEVMPIAWKNPMHKVKPPKGELAPS